MSEIVIARNGTARQAMHAFLGAHGVPLPYSSDFQAIGVVRDGHLVAVVAFNNFCGRVCSMHVAGAGGHWISRKLLNVVFDYPFRQLDMVAVLVGVGEDNERAIGFDKHLGFQEVHRVREGAARGVDLVVLELRRADCRYIGTNVVERDEREAVMT